MTVAELIEADTSGLLGKHSTWERVSLTDVAHILNGAPFDSSLFSLTEGMPLVRIRDVVAGETKTFYCGPYEDDFLVKPNDLLVGMDGDFHSGYWGAQTALLNQRVCKISPAESFYDKRLLALALPGYLMAINANTPSVTVKHLSSKTIGEIGLPLPPRKEQTRIVDKLEEILTGLEAGVAELKTAQKKLAQYRQSLLKAAVEGALTAEWRATNKPTETGAQLLERILQERRARWEAKQLAKFKEQDKVPPKDWQKKYPEPVQPDTTDLPELPSGWVWASAETLYSWGSGDFLPASVQIDGAYSVYGGNGINGQHNAANVAYETIVIGRVGVHCGNVYRTKSAAWITDNAIYATSKHDCVTWQYSELVMQAARLGASSKGGAQPFISQKILNDTRVAVPPINEQEQIFKAYIAALRASEEMFASFEISLKQANAQRQNILKAAFSGQLVPQDPSDEPASELLARIRAERAAQQTVKKPRGRKAEEAA
jgi:type I restriction enzyme S subunit